MLVDLWDPIGQPDICEMHEKHKANAWTTEYIDFTRGQRAWDCNSEHTQHVMSTDDQSLRKCDPLKLLGKSGVL